MRSAAEVVDLCRLPRLPHDVLGLDLTPRQALYFDLSYIRAAHEVRMYDTHESINRVRGDDWTGAATVAAILLHERARS